MCINENPNENDNRPFQNTRTTTDINIVLDQQEAENTSSLMSTQTTQQTLSTNTNRQTQDSITFNADTRTICNNTSTKYKCISNNIKTRTVYKFTRQFTKISNINKPI